MRTSENLPVCNSKQRIADTSLIHILLPTFMMYHYNMLDEYNHSLTFIYELCANTFCKQMYNIVMCIR